MSPTTARQPSAPRVSAWRKSTRSADSGNGNCVEARVAGEAFELRDSKLGEESPLLPVSVTEFESLLMDIKSGKIA